MEVGREPVQFLPHIRPRRQQRDLLRDSFLGLHLSFLGRKLHYFVARKVALVLPKEFSDRFTYQVELVPPQKPGEPWSVLKQIPTAERVAARLRKRFPDVTEEIIQKRVRKFTAGTTWPREKTTPSTNGGALGMGVTCSTISNRCTSRAGIA